MSFSKIPLWSFHLPQTSWCISHLVTSGLTHWYSSIFPMLTVSVQGCFSSRLAQTAYGWFLSTPPPTFRGDPHRKQRLLPKQYGKGTGGKGEVLHGETGGANYQQSSCPLPPPVCSIVNYGPRKWSSKINTKSQQNAAWKTHFWKIWLDLRYRLRILSLRETFLRTRLVYSRLPTAPRGRQEDLQRTCRADDSDKDIPAASSLFTHCPHFHTCTHRWVLL